MSVNKRIYLLSFQKLIVKKNLLSLIGRLAVLLKDLLVNSPRLSSQVSMNLTENMNRLNKYKSVVRSDSCSYEKKKFDLIN